MHRESKEVLRGGWSRLTPFPAVPNSSVNFGLSEANSTLEVKDKSACKFPGNKKTLYVVD